MVRRQLGEAQWATVAAHLDSERSVGRPPKDDRMFIEAVLWWRRTGVPWRDLPSEFGPWKTVFNRFDRWSKNGKWARSCSRPQARTVDAEEVALDRQHEQPRARSTPRVEKGAAQRAIGRSRGGGLTTKAHLMVDALGLPVAFEITEGQRHDNQAAPTLIARTVPTCLLGDKGYDSNAIRSQLDTIGCAVVIPSTASRIPALPYDKELYKARSEVECTFNLLKQAGALCDPRYEKTLRNDAAVVTLGCVMLWLEP